MQLRSIADLSNCTRMEAEAFAKANSPLQQLDAWLETRNDPEVDLVYQQVLIDRAKRKAASVPKTRSTYRVEPSSIHKCSRMLWYQLMGEAKVSKIAPRIRRIFDTGHALHDMLQGFFEAIWGYDEIQDECFALLEDLITSGSTDGLREAVTIRHLMEYKTIKHEDFVKLGGSAQDGHVDQLHCYMRAFDTPIGYILYIDKDNQDMQEVIVVFDESRWALIEAKIQHVLDADADGPEKDVTSIWACRQCDYSYTCPKKG